MKRKIITRLSALLHTTKGEETRCESEMHCGGHESEIVAIGVKEVARQSCDADWLPLRLHPSRNCIQQRATTVLN